MNKAIKFDERKAKELEKRLLTTIAFLNDNREIFKRFGIEYNLSQIKEMAFNTKEYKSKIFLDKLKQRCQLFGFNFDDVKTTSTNETYTTLKNAANYELKDLYKFISNLLSVSGYINGNRLANNYEIINELFITDDLQLQKDYKERLKEYCTEYTENTRQDDILELAIKLQSIARELKTDYNINWFDARQLINLYTYEIEPTKLKRL